MSSLTPNATIDQAARQLQHNHCRGSLSLADLVCHGDIVHCEACKLAELLRTVTKERDALAEDLEAISQAEPACCFDCGLAYGSEGWIECVVPHEVWRTISPRGDEGGLLCITCIARRLKRRGSDKVPVMLCGTEAIRAPNQEEAFQRGLNAAQTRSQELVQDKDRLDALEREVPVSTLAEALTGDTWRGSLRDFLDVTFLGEVRCLE